MTLDIDNSISIRRPADQRRLVEAVIAAEPEDETHRPAVERAARVPAVVSPADVIPPAADFEA